MKFQIVLIFFVLLSLSSSAMEQDRQKFLDQTVTLAMKYHQRDYAEILLKAGAKLNGQERQSFLDEAIKIAVQFKQIDFIELLLKDGADPNKALVHASYNGFKELVSLFLEVGANIDGIYSWPGIDTPLTAATRNNHAETVQFLLEYRANVNKTDQDGFSPLIMAAGRGNIEIFKILLAHGADINAEYTNGSKALGFAAHHAQLERAKILVKLGADPTENNRDNMTPIYFASISCTSVEERTKMIEFFQSLKPRLEKIIFIKSPAKVYFKVTLIFNLPRELWSKIIGHVRPNIRHLINLRYVCKNFYNACLDIEPEFIDMNDSAYKDKYNYCIKSICCNPESMWDM